MTILSRGDLVLLALDKGADTCRKIAKAMGMEQGQRSEHAVYQCVEHLIRREFVQHNTKPPKNPVTRQSGRPPRRYKLTSDGRKHLRQQARLAKSFVEAYEYDGKSKKSKIIQQPRKRK